MMKECNITSQSSFVSSLQKTGLTSEEFVSLREEHIQKWKAIRER